MKVDLFQHDITRRVTLCGTNIYPFPEYHVDRIMEEHDLMYIHEGVWQIAQDGVIYDLKAGDVILLRAGSHHLVTAAPAFDFKIHPHPQHIELPAAAGMNLFHLQNVADLDIHYADLRII